jgi:hypothetical protein
MGYGSGCGTAIEQVIPTKYSAKIVPAKCGQTGIHGAPIFCEACEKLNAGRNWRREVIEAGENFDDEY